MAQTKYSTTTATVEDVIKNQQQEVMNKVNEMGGYYREHPDDFCEDYLNITLKIFQRILICFMNLCNQFMFLACRGLGKTFLVAVFCCVRCILYPGTAICIASGNRKQANLVLDKIINLIMPNAPNLRAEIESWTIGGDKGEIKFRNSSKIVVVTSRDSARGARANILITDEFRMVSQDVIQTVLKKFLSNPRHPGFFDLKEYQYQLEDGTWQVKPQYQERNKEIYMSSAWLCSHWSYRKAKGYAATMLDDTKRCFICGFPYQLAIKEGLLMKEQVEDDMAEPDYNEVSWQMEMDCLFYGDFDGSFFEFPSVTSSRQIKYPWLPPDYKCRLLSDKRFTIPPKRPKEIRILSVDVALMASSKKHNNDATAIFINSVIPNANGRCQNNIVFSESSEGLLTREQALQVRKLYDQFECDYIVIDANGIGQGVYDALIEDIKDPVSGYVYPALSCCNNPEMAARCKIRNAPKVIWAIKASAQFNSDCALRLREGFKSGKIKMLINEFDAQTVLSEVKGYANLNPEEQTELTKQYIYTTMLVNELVNLETESNNKLIKVKEKSGMRKDRYSSLSYNYYVSTLLENDNKTRDGHIYSVKDFFKFRAPKEYKRR